MNKLALATIAVTTIAAMGIAPAFAQSRCEIRCGYTTSTDNCGDQLGYLKRVYPAEVQGIARERDYARRFDATPEPAPRPGAT